MENAKCWIFPGPVTYINCRRTSIRKVEVTKHTTFITIGKVGQKKFVRSPDDLTCIILLNILSGGKVKVVGMFVWKFTSHNSGVLHLRMYNTGIFVLFCAACIIIIEVVFNCLPHPTPVCSYTCLQATPVQATPVCSCIVKQCNSYSGGLL